MYSDDHALSWKMMNTPVLSGSDEAHIVQRDDGSLLLTATGKPHRYYSYSYDNGNTWTDTTTRTDWYDYDSNSEIFRLSSVSQGHDKNRIIHTHDDSSYKYANLMIAVSYDEGATWKYDKVIYLNYCFYSSVAVDKQGNIWIFWERMVGSDWTNGETLVITKLTLDWITDGADTFKP